VTGEFRVRDASIQVSVLAALFGAAALVNRPNSTATAEPAADPTNTFKKAGTNALATLPRYR
jgi:hypothetical protein